MKELNEHEYLEFLKKFEEKKTTDDCYTPPAVYAAVLEWVRENCNIEGLKVVRPFYPTGNYKKEDYTGCVVVDNPPFSMISKIIRFYNENKVKYFLFAPNLTLFGSNQDYTGIVVGEDLIYENGAKVNTSFVSNLFGDIKILGVPELGERIKAVQEKKTKALPKYSYPKNVVCVTDINAIVKRGIGVKIYKKDLQFCRGLDSQKPMKKSIFGSGFLCSNKVAQELEARKKEARRKEARQNFYTWELSEREKQIVKAISK